MPVAVTTAVPLASQRAAAAAAQDASGSGTTRSISLVTAPVAEKPTYHLMEVTEDMVKLFESEQGARSIARKRRRRDSGANGSEDDDGGEAGDMAESSKAKKHRTLCIKGRNDDEAVLCTDERTWSVRQVTQSNSLLLCALDGRGDTSLSQSESLTVRTTIVEILELVPIVPRMGRIQQILAASAYRGEEMEDKTAASRRYTPQQIASIVQASPRELQEGLREAHVVELDGHHRIIAPEYMVEALRALLVHIDANALSHESVPIQPAVDALVRGCKMRAPVALAVLTDFFGVRGSDKDDEVVSLYADQIVRFIGLQLLKEHARSPMLEEAFLDKWTVAVGLDLGSRMDIDSLKANFLRHPAPPAMATEMEPATVQHFAAAGLPLDVAARFQQLFRARAQWTFEDLCPYLTDVAIDDKKRDALLLKFTRVSTVSIPVLETKQERRARKQRGEADKPPMRTVKLYSARHRY